MNQIRRILKQVPGLQAAYQRAREMLGIGGARHSIRQTFGDIFHDNAWGSSISVSGSGSDLVQTSVVRQELPKLCAQLGVSRLLDAPCGDFNWMQHTDLTGVTYFGADIVKELIEGNSRQFGDRLKGRNFLILDLCSDPLPDVDLVFCRDCLVHLSTTDVFRALRNICCSNARYLLTTTFTDRTENAEIATGGWRPINLGLAPFGLPPPLKILNELCSEDANRYADKSLGLWLVSDIATELRRRGL